MPPTVEDRLQDILEAITEIDDIVRGFDFNRFVSDRGTRLLVERLLEIVWEASRSIPNDVKQVAPGIDWRAMVDFGNLLRHAYHTTKAEIVWTVIQTSLPPLKYFVEHHIEASKR
jgi:uncharacterized protein with HEPN domain